MEPMPKPIALAHIPNVWRAESLAQTEHGRIATGYAALDGALGGGWPTPALIEVLCDREGSGELQLLRALWQPRSVQGCNEQRSVVMWLNAPFAVQAVALAQLGLDPAQHWCAAGLTERDALWAMEQALRSGSCAAVMAWSKTVTSGLLRRLKLAASSHDAIGVLFRPGAAASAPSPATLRLRLRPGPEQLQVELLKVQGRKPGTLRLSLHARSVHRRGGAYD
jgi:protein ImuA